MKVVRALVAAAAGAVLTAGCVAAWDSPLLDLRTVEVGGNDRVAARDVVLASGLSRRDHLLRISTAEVARGVEASPWVADATVERILPSSVRITVIEREPAAVVTAGTARYLVDREGIVLEEVRAGTAPAPDLPLVADLPVEALRPGERVGPRTYLHALAVLGSLPAPLRDRIRVVHAASPDALSLEVADGPVVVWGSAEGDADKAFAFRAVMERAASQGLELASIDVRVPTRPAALPRPPAAVGS